MKNLVTGEAVFWFPSSQRADLQSLAVHVADNLSSGHLDSKLDSED